MSSSVFKFSYDFASDLSGDDLELEMSTNACDLDELLQKFQVFLIAAGFDIEQVHAAVNNSELLPDQNELNVTCAENRIDYQELYHMEFKKVKDLEQELESMKFLFETENSLKVAYKKELIAAGLFTKELIDEIDD